MLCAVLGVHIVTGADTLGDLDDIQTVADWIISLQYTNPDLPSYGAIKIHHDPGFLGSDGKYYFRVVPYNSNLGVLGFLRAPVEDKLEVAEKWLDWYLSHLNMNSTPPGIVYDHWYLADGTGETTSPPGCDNSDPGKPNCDWDDASDSYAATFLSAAWAYYEEGGSVDFLNAPDNKEKFETIAEVILSLQDENGLTWAKEDYRVKFLMDNSEVYQGLSSMTKLEAVVFSDWKAAQRYKHAANSVRRGIHRFLFNRETKLYRVAEFEDGTFEEANLDIWYPGTVAIAWPHLFGVTKGYSPIAQFQMAALNDSWDGSPNPDWVTNIVDPAGFLWPSIGYAALLAGDWDRAQAHANFVKSLKFPTEEDPIGFSWPFAADDGGWLLRTFSAPVSFVPPLKFLYRYIK
jgi:hypothetical protein